MDHAHCLSCQKELTGRIDKRFCNSQCRSNFHNNNKRKNERIIAAVNRQIRKNRTILQRLCPDGKATVRKSRLLDMGFSFQYFSSVYVESALTYYFSYEYGFAPIMQLSRTEGVQVEKVLIIQYQEHMKGKFDPWKS
jgi:predicted nucleic acid-binding Zn ribbon protein